MKRSSISTHVSELEQTIQALRERNAELEYRLRAWDDSHAEMTAKTIAERDHALSELAQARKVLDDCREIITHSEMQCHHPADDGGPDCENIDDCVYHALIEAIDTARAAIP